MKKYLIICGVSLITGMAHAQENKPVQVPETVRKAFIAKFPSAKGIEWSQEDDGAYEAEFKLKGVEYSANFDKAGNWLETENEIAVKELPTAVRNSIGSNFAGYDIEEAEHVEKPGMAAFFEMEVEKGESSYEVQIAADGKILKKELRNEVEENDREDD